MHRGLPPDDPLRCLPEAELNALLDDIIESWPRWGLQADGHLALEIAAARRRGRPLDPGEPVPGCDCPTCTGIPLDHPARVPAWRRKDPDKAARSDRERAAEWERRLEAARSIPIEEILRRIGVEVPPNKRANVRCPLHDDSTPSMSVEWDKGLWHCHGTCAEGDDGIGLYMRARRVTFTKAVRELAGQP